MRRRRGPGTLPWQLRDILRRQDRRRRPSGSAPAPVEPPRGPQPLSGGAEAPLEFDA